MVALTMFLASSIAPAGVEEQRRRLPPPAQACSDPITGFWRGHEMLNGRWYKFTLDIERVTAGGPELTGEIESHSWDGGPDQTSPPPCDDFRNEFILDMPATGRFEDNHVSFVGQSWKLRESLCGRVGVYYPDGFSGNLIEKGTEFHSMSDDGHNPVVPVVFRRIKCGDDAKPTPELPEDEAPMPYASGCGGCF
jgi:hypothetical protein